MREQESKHTPGPWTIGTWNDARNCVPIFAKGNTIAGAFYLGGTDPAKANARLIAAAPDMLAALHEHIRVVKIFLDKLGGFTAQDFADCTSQARAAIAKAEGRHA